MHGGADNDLIAGGKGADIFKLSKGIDTVTDFKLEDGDRIAVDVEKFNLIAIDESVTGALISVEGIGSMVLTGVSAEAIKENSLTAFVKYIV